MENKSGRSAITVGAVVDATGDADVCRLSGADCATYAAGNALAGWYYTVGNDGVRLREVGACTDTERYFCLSGEEISAFVQRSHQRSIEHYRRLREQDPTAVPSMMATVPQVRMTRRIVGVATPDDTPHLTVPTSIGMCGDWRRRGPMYELPLECLYGHAVRNLITAGRNISVTDAMWVITRVIPVCAVTGQAAGTAAAMGQDFASIDVALLQTQLRADGVKLHRDEVL